MAVRVWDESRHPRDPGGEGGGQWVESGASELGDWISGADPGLDYIDTLQTIDVAGGEMRIRYKPSLPVEASYSSGDILVGPKFFELPEANRRFVVAHEIGHSFDSDLVDEFPDLMDPVSWEDAKGVVFGGPATNVYERVADAYAALGLPEGATEKERWPVFAVVEEYARRRGFPLALTAAFDPLQPRHPKGGPEGGQWLAVGTRITHAFAQPKSGPAFGTVVEPIYQGVQHKNDVSVEWDDGTRQRRMKGEVRPTRPGEEAQYAPKAVVPPPVLRVMKGDPGFPPYFPEGVFAPSDRVAFWPKLVGHYNGSPLWKALVLKDDPSRSVFWIADPMGQPSHGVMLNAIKAAGGVFPEGTPAMHWDDLHDLSGFGQEPISGGSRPEFDRVLVRHAQDIRDAQDIVAAQESLSRDYTLTPGMAAAGFDPAKHPRHPSGTDAGGEFAPTHFGPGDSGFPRNFPDGVFSPTDDVVFWPMEIGANTMGTPRWHPLWKALVDRDDPSKRLFWFTDPMGAPHHEQMLPWAQRKDIMGDRVFDDMWSGDPHFLSGFGWQNQWAKHNGADHPLAVVTQELTSKNGDAIADAQRIVNEQREPSRSPVAVFHGRRESRFEKGILPEQLRAAGFDPSQPRDPGGEGGGQWTATAPAARRIAASQIPGFPEGVLSDGGDVMFWPRMIGERNGAPFWKALLTRDGHELAFWFANPNGFPHHAAIGHRLGLTPDTAVELAGYGKRDAWGGRYRGANHSRLLPRELDEAAGVVERHGRAIDVATDMLYVQDALAASAADPFQVAWEEGQRQAETHLEGLQAAFAGALLAEGRKIVKAYRTANLVAAAEQPGGNTPSSQIIDEILFKEAVLAAVRATQLAIISRVVLSIADDPKLARLPVYEMLLADVNVVQSQAAFEAVSDSVNRVLLESLTEGWDVPDTAERLNTVLTDFAPWQATRLARTSLISLANGSSLLAAQALGEDAPTFKTWLTAGDELVRPTHVQADRQTVPVDQPFDVDGVPMMFPGDPSAPDALKQNCRCTLVYGSDPHPLLAYSEDWMVPDGELALSAAFDPAKHPRHPGGSERGGEWANTFTIEDFRHGTPEWWALGKVGDDPSKVGARIEMRADPDWKAMMMVSQERGRGDPSKTNEGRAQAAYGLALEAFNAENVLVARKDGQIVGVLGYSIGQERVAGAMYRTVWGGYAGAIKGGGLPLFKGIVKIAAAEDAGLAFQSTTASDDLYDRLGVPKRLMPSGNEYLDEYFVSPEQVKMLDQDMFALARERRLAADGEPWVEPELVWLTAAGWDESRVSRNPSGEHDGVESPSDGGKFRAKHGASGSPARQAAPPTTVAEASRRIAASVLALQLEGVDLVEDEIRALLPSQGEYAGDTVYGAHGGASFSRMPNGTYIIEGGMMKDERWDPTRYETADEAIAAMKARLVRPELRDEAAANWAKRLKGGVIKDKAVLALFTSADARNAESAAYRDFTRTWGADRTPVVVLSEAGTKAFGKDILNAGFYDPGTGVVFVNGERVAVGLSLVERDRQPEWSTSTAVREKYDYGTRVGPMLPGKGSAGDTIDALVRHETGHAAWARMPKVWRDEFVAAVPADYDTRAQLSRYAADSEEYYREFMRGGDNVLFPWQGEVFAETVAATMDPAYDPADWPAWVNDLGVRIREAKP